MGSGIKENSTNQVNKKILSIRCGVNDTLDLIGKRWLMTILYEISLGNNQFSSLRKSIPEISEQMLATRVGYLTAQGLISKEVISDAIPVQIVYSVSSKGKELLSLVDELCQWNRKWRDDNVASKVCK
ncbi:winged helix-turn-helix transcriptional regulator [Sphingobacterium sp. LRF_L2]|uniref:winged helix-turn-helix transcriptional regulator n=1 Tax=Sphingobacterium sp. LRF_L2 TaxID=3369421 RepID=UPI003F5D8175